VDATLIKLTQRIREEFEEAPGLRLTANQAARFWGLDLQTCEAVLDELRRAGFLFQRADASYQQLESVTASSLEVESRHQRRSIR
jgi:Fic family protein